LGGSRQHPRTLVPGRLASATQASGHSVLTCCCTVQSPNDGQRANPPNNDVSPAEARHRAELTTALRLQGSGKASSGAGIAGGPADARSVFLPISRVCPQSWGRCRGCRLSVGGVGVCVRVCGRGRKALLASRRGPPQRHHSCSRSVEFIPLSHSHPPAHTLTHSLTLSLSPLLFSLSLALSLTRFQFIPGTAWDVESCPFQYMP
jgi:hypothetical protein